MKLKNIKASNFIPPYTFNVSESCVYVRDGHLMTTFKVDGISFESVNDNDLVLFFNEVKRFFSGLCRQFPVAFWTHIVKKKTDVSEKYLIKDNVFLQNFYDKYIDELEKKDFYKIDYLITIAIKTSQDKDAINNSLDDMNEIIHQVNNCFKNMNCINFGCEKGISLIASEYLSFLYNHKEVLIPLSATEISKSIPNSDIFFGFDVAEIKEYESLNNLFCSNYVMKDFPRTTQIGQWDFLLMCSCEFVLTQSFIPQTIQKSIKDMDKRMRHMRITDDKSESQHDEMMVGQESLINGEMILGMYHSVLSVFGDTAQSANENGAKLASEFLTSGRGFRFVKSTSDAQFVYFSHLPLSKNPPLSTKRTLTNLMCTFSFHNTPSGKKSGNPIGDGSAIMPLKTAQDGIYYFNTHYSDLFKNVTGQKIAGHALILGATGTGKTTFEGASAAFLQRFNPSLFVVDFNRSTELFVRAFGGEYFAFQDGVYTGLNPFQIANNDDLELISFLKAWVKRCAVNNDGTDCTDNEAIIIDNAVDSVMGLPINERRFGDLLQSIPSDSDLSLRLKKWCGNGAYAWALDSEFNKLNPDNLQKIGFDTTVILEKVGGKNHPACEPILSILFFYKNRMQKNGDLMLSIVEEFWMPANFPMTQEMIKSSLKAGRMKGEMMWLTSQSPEDAINCEIFAAIVQQTSTKICLPNPDARWQGYKEIGLTQKEFEVLKGLGRESRMMLIKQSNASILAKMDLSGFDDYLPIISGSKKGISICENIIKEYNNSDPNFWIPIFLKQINKGDL